MTRNQPRLFTRDVRKTGEALRKYEQFDLKLYRKDHWYGLAINNKRIGKNLETDEAVGELADSSWQFSLPASGESWDAGS